MNNQEKPNFSKKETILPDGRYLIYYDFNKCEQPSPENAENQEKLKGGK